MKVLSWDVGIINLAYCLIDYDYDTKKFKIIDWDVINLTNRAKMKCTVCKVNPSFYQQSGDKYFCKIHMKNADIIVPSFEDIFGDNNMQICCYEGKTRCNKQSKYCYNDIMLCNVHAKSKYKSIQNTYKIVKYTKKAISTMSMDDFLYKLIVELDKRHHLLQCDRVYIENQPTMKNPRMKTISVTLYNFYMIRGMIDKQVILAVHFMAPSNKLKLASDGDIKELVKIKKNDNDAKTYKLTKSLGIKYCLEMISDMPDWVAHFNSHKKKDDLADCFLQGMYALLNK